MADKRELPSHGRHVHMSHVKEHLRRATRHAAAIHGRGPDARDTLSVPPNCSAPPSSPRNPHSGGGGASSTPR